MIDDALSVFILALSFAVVVLSRALAFKWRNEGDDAVDLDIDLDKPMGLVNAVSNTAVDPNVYEDDEQ